MFLVWGGGGRRLGEHPEGFPLRPIPTKSNPPPQNNFIGGRAHSDPPHRLQDRTVGPRLGGRKPLPIHADLGARQCECAWLGGGWRRRLEAGSPDPSASAGRLSRHAFLQHVSAQLPDQGRSRFQLLVVPSSSERAVTRSWCPSLGLQDGRSGPFYFAPLAAPERMGRGLRLPRSFPFQPGKAARRFLGKRRTS